MSDFRVVIVGGSIAGLTLAKTLELYGIDYVLLEKYSVIGPQLGASVSIQPHASKILDQLGVLDEVTELAHPIYEDRIFGPFGQRLRPPQDIKDLNEGLRGYPLIYLDRQQLLLVLYHSIQDHSKIHVESEVDKIEELDGFVRVVTKNGKSFKGDIVVGADGAYSQIREEMWRIADKETPGYSEPLRKSITCSYKCIFGISDRPKGTPDNITFSTYHENHSYNCVSGPDGKIYWSAFFKNDKTVTDKDIPHYKAEEARELALKHGNDHLFHGLQFGDFIARQKGAVMVPVEEYVLDKNFYKRAILIGDSFHKLNPLTGHGADFAMETATLLANHLKEILEGDQTPNNEAIQNVFSQVLAVQKLRTTRFLEDTKSTQRSHALESSYLKYKQLKLTPRLNAGDLATVRAAESTPAPRAKYLPEKFKTGAVLADEDVVAKPRNRSSVSTNIWVILMLLVALVGPVTKAYLDVQHTMDPDESRVLQTYLIVMAIAINSIWVLESHRPARWTTLSLISAIPYSISASYIFGWEIITPIYFAVFILVSAAQEFYYPNPRAINPSTSAALPYAVLIAYAPLTMRAVRTLLVKPDGDFLSAGWDTNLAHLSFPFLVQGGKELMASASKGLKPTQLQFETRDMNDLSRFYNVLFLFTSAAHLVLLSQFIPNFVTIVIADLTFNLSSEWVEIGSLTLAIVVWSLFTVWDMQRVNLTQISLPVVFLGSLIGSVLLGPASVLVGLWWWREYPLERGRHKP